MGRMVRGVVGYGQARTSLSVVVGRGEGDWTVLTGKVGSSFEATPTGTGYFIQLYSIALKSTGGQLRLTTTCLLLLASGGIELVQVGATWGSYRGMEVSSTQFTWPGPEHLQHQPK